MQVDDTEAVKFLLKNEVIPLCLRIMGTGSELSKTVCHSSFAFAQPCHIMLSYRILQHAWHSEVCVDFGTLYIIKDLLIGMIGHLLSFCYQPHAIQILSSLFGMIWHASLFQYVM
jgi:hypothetical protein